MAKIPFSISFYDVEYVLSQAGKTLDDLTSEEIEEILFSIGMQREGMEVEEVMHRPKFIKNNEAWLGNRYIGMERQDKDWLYSGKSSLENIIASQTDMSHKRDLVLMSQQSSCGVAEICEALEDNKKGNK